MGSGFMMRLFAEFDRVAAEYSPPHDRLAVDPMYGYNGITISKMR